MTYDLTYTRREINKIQYKELRTIYRGKLKEINPEIVEFIKALIINKVGTEALYYNKKALTAITNQYFENNKTKKGPFENIININGTTISEMEYKISSNIAMSNLK